MREQAKTAKRFVLYACIAVILPAFAILTRPAATRESAGPPTVKLDSGVLEGIRFAASPNEVAFLGVPYAAPPVGALRWKAPAPPPSWNDARQATSFGSVCPQLPQGWLPYIEGSEDCLYLNVWTTQLAADARRPVIVFFHGGSNTAGYSQLVPLGPPLSRMGVVVVTANYRLGPFGFLAHPVLTAESEHHSSGNYGLLDQIQVLRWVHENIAQFGGDPARVTVMGQSAGAVDICLLMSSPLAKGLFRGAILQSGECQSTWNEDIRQSIHYNFIEGTGEAVGERLATDLGISDGPDALRKLRGASTDEILKAWRGDSHLHFDAIVDGFVVPEQPAKIFATGKQLAVPVVIGSNKDEATVFGNHGVTTLSQYKQYLSSDSGKFAEQEFAAYPATADAQVTPQRLQLENDSFAYGAYSMAEAITHRRSQAYLYYFTFAEAGKREQLGAYHGLELHFLSDSFPNDWQLSDNDKQLGELMRGYWVQFAKTGDPNFRGAPDWPAFNPPSQQRMELGRSVVPQPVPPKLRVLEAVMQNVLADGSETPAQAKSD